MSTPSSVAPPPAQQRWLRRLGAAGFAFFLIKGLLWIVLPILAAMGLFALHDDQPTRPAEVRLVAD